MYLTLRPTPALSKGDNIRNALSRSSASALNYCFSDFTPVHCDCVFCLASQFPMAGFLTVKS